MEGAAVRIRFEMKGLGDLVGAGVIRRREILSAGAKAVAGDHLASGLRFQFPAGVPGDTFAE